MEPILGYFGSNLGRARMSFLDFVSQNIKSGHCAEFSSGDKGDARFLGPDDFMDMIYEKAEPEALQKPGIKAVIEAVEGLYGLSEGGLAEADRSFKMAEARSMAAWAVREMSDATLTELGLTLGRDVTSLSSSIARLLTRAKNDDELAERMQEVKKILHDFATLQA